MSLKIHNSILDLVGNTPVIRLNHVVDKDCAEVLVKLEYFNPSKSVKDRAAYSLIAQAEQDGRLKPGATIIEPTSGNTGIGLAMNAAAKGYKAIFVMPDNMTKERIDILKAYGAKVVLTAAAEKMGGAVRKALQLHEEIPNSFVPQQFENKANPAIHRLTTAPEIIEQTGGKLDIFVATAGTGGTITGTGEVLKETCSNLKVVVVEPKGSAVLSGQKPGSHKIVGTSPGFIPQILNTSVYDEIVLVEDDDAWQTVRDVAKYEGLLLGPSAGAAIWAAIQQAKLLGPNKRVLCIAPDNGERYLSIPGLFDK